MPALQVDGMTVRVPDGASLLTAARAAGAKIPTLCHHEAVEAWGGCRLCLVEVSKAAGSRAPQDTGRESRLVAACLYPAADGLVVRTSTPDVVAARRVAIDLLLARCPTTPLVQRLAQEYGIEDTSFQVNPEPTDCVLCGLCTRVCDRIGVSAIASVSRGAGRAIGTPFDRPPADCLGCLACARVCPTGHIRATEDDGHRTIWGRTFEMARCGQCGRAHLTVDQVAWAGSRGTASRDLLLCDACKRKELARTLNALQGEETVGAGSGVEPGRAGRDSRSV